MVDFHLLGEILFKPFIFFYVFIDELDCQLTVNLYGGFTCFTIIDPGFSPPSDTASVGIDTDKSRYVKTLYVNLQFGKWIDESATGYCFVIGFFFTA